MGNNFCIGCSKEFDDDEEQFEIAEDAWEYLCLECVEDMKDTCPRCSGHGCGYCLCTEW